jgi:hypothetical protein
MSSLEIPDFENLSVYEEGLRGEICGWNVKATHEPDICPYSPRSKLILDSIDVNPDFDDKELKAEIRKPDYDLHLYGHSHLAFCRPDIFAVYNSPGSVSKMKNTNPDKDFPDRTLQVLNFEPDTLEVLTLDAEAMSVQEHRKYNRLDDNIIQEERIIGEFGVERVHADMRSRALDRYGEFSEDITLEEALKVRKKQFRKSNGISFQ